MISALYVIASVIKITLDACALAFLLRAFMPLFVDVESSKLYLFVLVITEPIVIPVRFILAKLNLFQNSPVDFSFIIAYLLFSFIRTLLPVI